MAEEKQEDASDVVSKSLDTEKQDYSHSASKPVVLPEVVPEQTADEERFECPQPWFLALLAVAMSMMTSITVAGSLFFVLAAPEKVSPHCYLNDTGYLRWLCTFSTLCFWTYPVVCCMFVVLVYAKNLVDQRLYYEFLLHKVVIGYGRANPFANKVVIALLLYAVCAFSALVWYHASKPRAMVGSVFASLAYITPIISFLAVILTQWSIQGKLITLPNFLQDYNWSVEHLKKSRCYFVDQVHDGFNALEAELIQSEDTLCTPRFVALVEHYSKKFPIPDTSAPATEAADPEGPSSANESTGETKAAAQVAELAKKGMQESVQIVKTTEYVYWPWRFLFNPRLQDERSQNFRNWTLGYLLSVILAIVLATYIYVCCFITCLEIERVLVPGTATWDFTHHFSLRPDYEHRSETSFKTAAADAAMSVIAGHGTKALFLNRATALTQFQLGAAAL